MTHDSQFTTYFEWPYLTSDVPAIGVKYRASPEDFFVEEIPAYEPRGSGSHVYFWTEKRGLSTHEALRRLASALGRKSHDVGFAGLKDAKAVSRQMFSIEHMDPKRVQSLKVKDLSILSVSQHTNKLKTGHLKGNRFILKLRDVKRSREDDLRQVLKILERKGVPNYFGDQRFGVRGDTWRVGLALLRGEYSLAARWIVGEPSPADSERVRGAREAFFEGDYSRAVLLWPAGFREASVLSRGMARRGGDFKKAVLRLDRRMLKFYISAFQSRLFNDYAAARLSAIDDVLPGDWAVKHSSGALFFVERGGEESARAERFEISAAGPLFGKKMREASGEPRCLEKKILERFGIAEEVFSRRGYFFCAGDRRPVRFKPMDVSLERAVDGQGDYYRLGMTLPSGCYATSLLREVGKEQLVEGS